MTAPTLIEKSKIQCIGWIQDNCEYEYLPLAKKVLNIALSIIGLLLNIVLLPFILVRHCCSPAEEEAAPLKRSITPLTADQNIDITREPANAIPDISTKKEAEDVVIEIRENIPIAYLPMLQEPSDPIASASRDNESMSAAECPTTIQKIYFFLSSFKLQKNSENSNQPTLKISDIV